MAAPSFTNEDFKAPLASRSEGSSEPPAPEETPLGYFLKSTVKGAAEQTGRNVEASVPLRLYGAAGLPESLVRAFVPRGVADFLFPLTKRLPMDVVDARGKKTRSTVGDTMLNPDAEGSPERLVESSIGSRGPAPGLMSESLGRAGEFFGQTVANPLGAPAGLGRMALMSMGAGIGSEAGEKIGGATGRTAGRFLDRFADGAGIFEDAMGKTGEVTGSLAGGAAGAQANVMRGKALGAASDAAKAAWQMRKDEARQSLGENFADNYSAMHAQSRGIIQEHVNEKIAEALSKNAQTPEKVQEIESAAKTAGVDLEKSGYDLAQRTADPSLILMMETQKPRNLDEAMTLARREQGKRGELVSLFKRFEDESLGAKDVVDSLEDLRQATKIKVSAIAQSAKKEADVVVRLSPDEKKAMGDRLQGLYEQEKKQADPVRDSWYGKIQQAAAAIGTKNSFDLSGVKEETEKILGTSLAKIDPSTAPTAISRLKTLIEKSQGIPEATERVEKRPGLFETVKTPGKAAEPITYEDISDAIRAMNRERPIDPTAARNIASIRGSLERTFLEQAPEEVKQAWLQAQSNYKNLYAPRFREGVNFNLNRDASVARRGENYYAPDMGMDPYLNDKELVTRMKQFQNLFGGTLEGTQRNQAAFEDLSKAVQDKYSKEMFSGGKFSEEKHGLFMERHEPVFNLVPGAKDIIEKQAAKYVDLMQTAKNTERAYTEAIRSPLNTTLGVDKANRLVSDALSDPRRMNQLISTMEKHGGTEAVLKDVTQRINIMKDGEFDPFRMDRVLKDGEPGLRVLFAKRFGPTQGEEQYNVLKAIATLGKRQTISDARQMPPAERVSTDPIKSATGSSGASFMSYWRSTTQGYTSPPYIASLAGGRYLNAQLQNSLHDAELRAFNDPEMAKAVLEMYAKKAGEPVTMQTAKKVFGSGTSMAADVSKKFIDWMVDRGYVMQTTSKAAQVSATSYLQEQDDKRNSR